MQLRSKLERNGQNTNSQFPPVNFCIWNRSEQRILDGFIKLVPGWVGPSSGGSRFWSMVVQISQPSWKHILLDWSFSPLVWIIESPESFQKSPLKKNYSRNLWLWDPHSSIVDSSNDSNVWWRLRTCGLNEDQAMRTVRSISVGRFRFSD